ncbi:LysR family transcriptional regulator [Methylocella tundrae]|uniref:Transcriptional regulator, LysR family n=1 Tax=Methylocella tundrae TaxID=227605 RepID=A0A4U8Z203_METTU|nr:LysR family transcriptional regulator [Methylocella tundrae]WPP03365.1 LysR family transcriptional regulator [Methylocella tundrae]VFU09412.1 Transcriptional regulator, LysR family [Methylocella tundrae]
MSKLPDLEGLAIFAKVVEMRSIAATAADLGLSSPTVSKALSRLEKRLGARLFNRTSRRLALTDAGQQLAERATRLVTDAEAAENDLLAQSANPRGLVRLAAPMSFGLREVAPILPDFLNLYPEVSVDLHLSDAIVDLIGDGFDAALRLGFLPDSSLIARRLCASPRYTVAAPSYLARRGCPAHPAELARHVCLGYTYLQTPDIWRFSNAAGEEVAVKPKGQLRANNGDALMPALIAGLGIGDLPEFIVKEALADGRLKRVLTDWLTQQGSLFLVTPPGGPRPARVEVLADFLGERLARRG